MNFNNLRTVKQAAEEGPWTEATWRWHIFHADKNGLERALVRVGRRLYIDMESFACWLEDRRGGSATSDPGSAAA